MRKVQRHVTGLLFRLLIGYTHRSELGRVSHSSERAHRNGTVYSGVCEIQVPSVLHVFRIRVQLRYCDVNEALTPPLGN